MTDLDEGENSILEFEFQYEYKSRATGQQVVAKYTNYTGRYTQDTILYLPVLFRKPDAFGKVYGALIEDDGYWSTDHLLLMYLFDETHNKAADPTEFDPSYNWYDGFYHTLDGQLSHIWHPSSYTIGSTTSSTPGEYAVISGSSSVPSGGWCTYMAGTSLSGATIEWFIDGDFVGTGGSLMFTAPSHNFDIVVGAYDSNGQWAWDQLSVDIDPNSTCEAQRRVKRPPLH